MSDRLAGAYPTVQALLSPVQRLGEVPVAGWAAAIFAGLSQWLLADRFNGALGILVLAAVLDFAFGIRAAKHVGIPYKPGLAHAGAMGKLSGFALLLLVRLLEGWAFQSGFVDTKGGFAVMLAVALIVVDLTSIAHHRETFGATPIPILGQLLAVLKKIVSGKVMPGGKS